MRIRSVVLLVIICIILGMCCVGSYIMRDKVAPEIKVPTGELVYTEGGDTDSLLEGAIAYDNKDGDLSRDVRIYDIAVMEDGKHALVTYAVYDYSDNLAKKNLIVKYVPRGAATTEAEPDDDEKTIDENTETDENIEKDENIEADENTDITSEKTDNTDVDNSEKVSDSENNDPEKPYIELLQDSVELNVGDYFDYSAYIKSIGDAQDSLSSLYQNINCNGDYNMYQAGTYTLDYFVVDSDGNESEHKELTLKVKNSNQ